MDTHFPFFLDHLTLNNSTHLYSTKHPFKIRVHRIIQPYYINSSCSFFSSYYRQSQEWKEIKGRLFLELTPKRHIRVV